MSEDKTKLLHELSDPDYVNRVADDLAFMWCMDSDLANKCYALHDEDKEGLARALVDELSLARPTLALKIFEQAQYLRENETRYG